MLNYKLVIFDWDGTLVDSTGRIIDSMQQAAREVQLPVVADAAVQNIIGLGLPEALETLWPGIAGEQMAVMIKAYARFFVSDSQVGMGFFPGAVDFLEGLLRQERLLAVATGKSRKGLDRMLRDLQVGHLFAATRCADETRSKPHPLMLEQILAELSVAPHEALMIGDTTYDLNMATAAGVASVAMGHGAHDESQLLACRPLAVCHSIAELNDWVQQYG